MEVVTHWIWVIHALHIENTMYRYVKLIFYVKGHTVADPPLSGYSLQHCWSSSLTGCCWRTLSSSFPDQHVTHPDEKGWNEGWKDVQMKRGGGRECNNNKNELKSRDRKTGRQWSLWKVFFRAWAWQTFFPSRMDLKGLKGISAYITIHKHRLFGLPHKASSSQSVIVFPDAKSLCLPLPFTITPLIIPY